MMIKRKRAIILLLILAALASVLVFLDGERIHEGRGLLTPENSIVSRVFDLSENPVSDSPALPADSSSPASNKKKDHPALIVSGLLILNTYYQILISCENALIEAIGVDGELIRPVVFWGISFISFGVLFVFVLCFLKGFRALIRGEKDSDIAVSCSQYPYDIDMERNIGVDVQTYTVNTRNPAHFRDAICDLFLNIYKIQIGAPREAPARCLVLKGTHSGRTEVFELQVKNKGEWSKRRMSLGPLGEESSSTSKCFYVLYDTHMVVKIPHIPHTNFNSYIKFLLKQSQVKDALHPIECIVPKVSVLLNKIYKLSNTQHQPPDEIEKEYTRRLQKNHIFQNYLKIGNTFVFFMDLAQHSFMSTVNRDIHNIQDLILSEIDQNFKLLWDHQGFVGRYGIRSENICSEIQHIYRDYDEKVRILLGRNEIDVIHPYQLKKWFISHLSHTSISHDEAGLNPESISALNEYLVKIMVKNKNRIDRLKEIIADYVQETAFARNRIKIKNLIAKNLALLINLREKQIAMRDLKPDNLLVVGDPENYPDYLKIEDQFSIGIIDVETAISWRLSEGNGINQPLLGGTPLYATPSHLMKNEILSIVYGGLDQIFHFQDWFACIGIIYKIIIMESLFRETATLFSSMANLLQKSTYSEEKQIEIAKQISAVFWKKASGEFKDKVSRNSIALEMIRVEIPKEMIGIFKIYVLEINTKILAKIQNLVVNQNVYKTDEKREEILDASSDEVTRLKSYWESNLDLAITKPQARKRAIRLLVDLEAMKKEEESSRSILHLLNNRHPQINAKQLLEVMFGVVMQFMCRQEWKTGTIDIKPSSSLSTTETFYEATM